MRWRKVKVGENKYDAVEDLGVIRTGMDYESCTIWGDAGAEQPCLNVWTAMRRPAQRKYETIKHLVIGNFTCRGGATDVVCMRTKHPRKGHYYGEIILTIHEIGHCPCTIYRRVEDVD